MRSRRLILGLILLTLLAMCLAVAAKLRATPKYDRIQVGMTYRQVEAIIGEPPVLIYRSGPKTSWEGNEGVIVIVWHVVVMRDESLEFIVREKRIERRGPLERLAWLAGWRR